MGPKVLSLGSRLLTRNSREGYSVGSYQEAKMVVWPQVAPYGSASSILPDHQHRHNHVKTPRVAGSGYCIDSSILQTEMYGSDGRFGARLAAGQTSETPHYEVEIRLAVLC